HKQQVAGSEPTPGAALALAPVERLGADEDPLAAVDAPPGEIDGQILVAEGHLAVGRHKLANPRLAVPATVGIDDEVLAVRERGGQPAACIQFVEPGDEEPR